MKNNSPKETDIKARDLVHLAERNLERVLTELDAMIGELEARGSGAEARVKTLSADVRKAIQTVFEERHRIEKLDEKSGGGSQGAGLDLEAARAEIGRRLARLRANGDAGAVFEGAER